MTRILIGFWCVFTFSSFGSSAGPQVNQAIKKNAFQPEGSSSPESVKIQQLYSLLDESALKETLSQFSLITPIQNRDNSEMPLNVLSVHTSTERLYTSKVNVGFSGDDNLKQEESKIISQNVSLPLLIQASTTSQDDVNQTTTKIVEELSSQRPTTKSPLEYQSLKSPYASAPGGISGGHLGQLIPCGDPLPVGPLIQHVTIEDRLKETTTSIAQEVSKENPTTKSPLEYQSHKSPYASAPGGISGGHLGQLIPSGDPLPAGPLIQNVTIEDRLRETTTSIAQEVSKEKPTTKSPLEYQSHKSPYASAPGGISGGYLGQLIPSGDPLPAGPLIQNVTIEDRLKETTASTAQEVSKEKPTTKSPLEYQSHKSPYASAPGGISGGHLGQLIPSGDPLPAGPLIQNVTIEDRLKETTTSTAQEVSKEKPTTKSPLVYQSQKPSFASAPGGISGGHLGPLIPSGDPLPAGPLIQNVTIEDRLKETTSTTIENRPSLKPSTRLPWIALPGILEGIFGGQFPPLNPIPASSEKPKPDIEDRFQETTVTSTITSTTVREKTSTKSPLEYQDQKPSYAGSISGGNYGPLIPPGKPWPADPVRQKPILEDRFKETTTTIIIQERPSPKPSTQSPLEYDPQRPTFTGSISGGNFGPLIPPGKPWPADPVAQSPVLEDRFKETTTTTIQEQPSQKPGTQSPLEYDPQRPTFTGSISGGNFGALIPPGKPWPVDPVAQRPVLEDRFKETTTTTIQERPSQKPGTQSPLEYDPQRPTFTGSISGGNFGALIPPGKPWPADPVAQRPVLEDRFKETTTTTVQERPSQKPGPQSPLEYDPQRPTFTGSISGGNFGALIPPGKPWPADPVAQMPVLEDRFKETTSTIQERPSQKPSTQSSLEYNPQRPSFTGAISGGHFGPLIPPGRPWPANK